MDYRKKWTDNWDAIKYCSKACRRNRVPRDNMARILSLLTMRDPGKSICPSEILAAEDKKNQQSMERVRDAARLLAHEGSVVITQKGKVIDPANFKGPIRLSRGPSFKPR